MKVWVASKCPKPNQENENVEAWPSRVSAATETVSSRASWVPTATVRTRAATLAPNATRAAISRNQPSPTAVARASFAASSSSKSERVALPAGVVEAMMNRVVATTTAHPLRNPRKGCRVPDTQE